MIGALSRLLVLAALPLTAWADPLDVPSLAAAARTGDRAAQMTLAQAYQDGDGVVQSYAEAATWYAQAAQAGDPVAQNALGRLYHEGRGVKADRAAALRWLKAAASQGAPEHQHDLASVLEAEDPAAAAALYGRAASAGLTEAAVSLAVLYQHGTGVPQDFDQARQLYQTAADAGHPRAKNNLGLLYVRGDGVPQNYDRAAALFAEAAARGLRPAMTNLGVMYANGFGVTQSDEEAARLTRLGAGAATLTAPQAAEQDFFWDPRLPVPDPARRDDIDQAARAGDPLAQFQMARLLVSSAAPDHADLRRAAALFRAGAQKGHPAAMVNLAQMHIAGRGVAQDYVLAQMWLLRARHGGMGLAGTLSAALEARMTADQINAAQTRAALMTGQ